MKNCFKDWSQSNGTVNLMDGGDTYNPDQHVTDLTQQQLGSTIDDETSVKTSYVVKDLGGRVVEGNS